MGAAPAVRSLRLWIPLGTVLLGAGSLAALAASNRLERADFAFALAGEVSTLDPQAGSGIPEARVARVLFEGLVGRHPETLAPVPAAAESWQVSEDGRTYVFRLRQAGRWSSGEPVTAHDFEASFRRILEPATAATFAEQLYAVVGAREYHTGLDGEGRAVERDFRRVLIRAQDERTLSIRLRHPQPAFLDLLACAPLSPVHVRSLEALARRSPRTWALEWTRPENLVTNGPYVLAERRLGDRLRFKRSPTYWDAGGVTFETIDALPISHWGTALNLYLAGEVDWLDGSVPPLLVPQLLGREDFRPQPYLGVYFYRINTTKPPLDDPRVRRALALAVHRGAICAKVLKAGQKPAWSLVPWGLLGPSAPPPDVESAFREARALFASAGYLGEGARPFPALEIHVNSGEAHRDVAETVAASWSRALSIEARLHVQEWKAYLDAQSALAYDVSRSSWIADVPDPLNFLEILTSGGPNNRTGWSDPEYDRLMEEARTETGAARRTELLSRAEAILRREVPVIPIYAYVSQNLVNPRLGAFAENRLNEQCPKDWYWRSDEELAEARAKLPAATELAPARGPRGGARARAAQGPGATAAPGR